MQSSFQKPEVQANLPHSHCFDNKGFIKQRQAAALPPKSMCANVYHYFAALWLWPAVLVSEGTITDSRGFVHSSEPRGTSGAARGSPRWEQARPKIANKLNLLRISFTSGKIASAKPDQGAAP